MGSPTSRGELRDRVIRHPCLSLLAVFAAKRAPESKREEVYMTTENPRAEKVAVVDEVSAKLTAAEAAIITEYRGMSVGQLATLRRQLRNSGGEYKVYKN